MLSSGKSNCSNSDSSLSLLDLAAIRKLLDSEECNSSNNGGVVSNMNSSSSFNSVGGLVGSSGQGVIGGCGMICSGCRMPFDKGKKRRLIDNCGHEICYSCMFSNESCPLCLLNITTNTSQQLTNGNYNLSNSINGGISSNNNEMNTSFSSTNGTSFTTTNASNKRVLPDKKANSLKRDDRLPPYNTNTNTNTNSSNSSYGKLFSKNRNKGVSGDLLNPDKLPKPKRQSKLRQLNQQQQENVMTQSCPTPSSSSQQTRRKFLFSPKALRSPFSSRHQQQQVPSSSNDCSSSSARLMSLSSSSADGGKTWSSTILGKIRSLWSTGSSSANTGLNQLLTTTTDSEDGNIGNMNKACPPPLPPQNDMYMRLGLLLGDRAKNSKSQQLSNASDSLYNIPSSANLSTNTSPISTLTGSSAEDPSYYAMVNGYNCSESMGSLLSVSMSSESRSFSPIRRRMGTQMVMHNYERCSSAASSSVTTTNHIVNVVNRRPASRESRFNSSHHHRQHQTQQQAQLTLKPLFFEVPAHESDSVFIGRDWLFCDMNKILSSSTTPGIIISGKPGTGKTSIILQLVEYSCFGRRKMNLQQQQSVVEQMGDQISPQSSIYCQIQDSSTTNSNEISKIANNVVAYHFCQADNNNTCLVPDFIHSISAQLCQTTQLISYRDHLLKNPQLQELLSLENCVKNPDFSLKNAILDPLKSLYSKNNVNCVILIDAVCEAEYHRPDFGETILSFIQKHVNSFPNWLKFVITIRSELSYFTQNLIQTSNFKIIELNEESNTNKQTTKNKNKEDLLEYIKFRVEGNSLINQEMQLQNSNTKFMLHLLELSKNSNFLFAKLTLDLLEKGYLVIKSSRFKVLPISLAQIYLLHFNLRFPTIRSFEKVSVILSVCLAALYPLTLLEIYYSVNSLLISNSQLSWNEFLSRFKLLNGFLVRRLDNTYMFFHPSFREWLIRRDDTENNKFLCDLRQGHAAIAFRLSRLQLQSLNSEKTLELAHHILKAHLYKNLNVNSRDLQAYWLAQITENSSEALSYLRNIYYPNVKVSRLLLLAGANPDFKIKESEEPLLNVFCEVGIIPMITLLIEFNADLNITNELNETPLILACKKGNLDVVRLLINAGGDALNLNCVDLNEECALTHASKNGHFNIVTYLLAFDLHNFNINKSLIYASSEDYVNIVEYLLDMTDVNINYFDEKLGFTALTFAVFNGCLSATIALLNRGVDVNLRNQRMKMSALSIACKQGHRSIVELLLKYGLNMNMKINIDDASDEETQRTPLMIAAMEGHISILELLLDNNANIEAEDSDGLTALCWACIRGRQQAIISLLDRGANINHSDKTGRTPLDLASFQGNPASVQILLERGAVIEHVDINGMRPLDRAIGNGNINVVQCFLKKGAKLGPATWTMASDKPEIMLILLNKLLEDGNILYHKKRLKEASHRYQYALKKFPKEHQVNEEFANSFELLKINFLLNFSRCKRKLQEVEEAIELANQVLELKPNAYEAYYARSKAKLDLKQYNDALQDIQEAIRLSPPQNIEITKTLIFIRDEIIKKIQSLNLSSQQQQQQLNNNSNMTSSFTSAVTAIVEEEK